MAVHCSRCGRKWARDPALEVPCPHCHAKIGQKCRRPSEHTTFGGVVHNARDRLALKQVPGYSKCKGRKT